MALTLYLHPLASFCHKVLIGLYENGTTFEPRIVDFADPGSAAALTEKWPVGKIPVLHDSAADRVVAAKEMPVRELVEDELILALPYAPRHAGCNARASTDAAEKVLPFAGLRGLMRGKH